MAVREILKMGDARLLRCAEEVIDFDTPELHALLVDMRDTMQALNGAGLAAPQIGVNLRVVIFGVRFNPRYPDAEIVPETVLINPVITPLTKSSSSSKQSATKNPLYPSTTGNPSGKGRGNVSKSKK